MARRTNLRKKPRNPRSADRTSGPTPFNVLFNKAVNSTGGPTVILYGTTPLYQVNTATGINVGGVAAVNVGVLNGTNLNVQFAANVSAGSLVVIPAGDGAIRSANGGFLGAGSYPTTLV